MEPAGGNPPLRKRWGQSVVPEHLIFVGGKIIHRWIGSLFHWKTGLFGSTPGGLSDFWKWTTFNNMYIYIDVYIFKHGNIYIYTLPTCTYGYTYILLHVNTWSHTILAPLNHSTFRWHPWGLNAWWRPGGAGLMGVTSPWLVDCGMIRTMAYALEH